MKSTALRLLILGIAGTILPSSTRAQSATPQLTRQQKQELRETAKVVLAPLPDKMPGSENDTPARIALGKKLFFETKLSKNESISCNSCHRVDAGLGGVDNASVSSGAFAETGDRNAPTVLNAGFHLAQFWDGRAPNLVEQAKGPILNPIEMSMPEEATVLSRLNADTEYPALFRRAFPDQGSPVTYQNLAEAIAAFERTLITHDRFDDFLKGDNEALSALELQGLLKFTQYGCTTCHTGPAIGGALYQKVGLVHPYENFSDVGREKITKDEDDRYKFKVPSLRNIALTAPYFHDGGVASLDFAVRKMAYMQLGLEISTEDTHAIVAFLKSLTDKERVPAK
jgi:cytochrome c peroxidase